MVLWPLGFLIILQSWLLFCLQEVGFPFHFWMKHSKFQEVLGGLNLFIRQSLKSGSLL